MTKQIKILEFLQDRENTLKRFIESIKCNFEQKKRKRNDKEYNIYSRLTNRMFIRNKMRLKIKRNK